MLGSNNHIFEDEIPPNSNKKVIIYYIIFFKYNKHKREEF